ncbi:cell division protein FtsQ/DivIB [Rhodoflexus sp.]
MRRFRLKKRAKIILVAIAIFAAVGFAGRQYARVANGQIQIQIDYAEEGQLLTESDIEAIVNDFRRGDSLVTQPGTINLVALENRIRQYEFVEDCQVSRDLKGTLIIKVAQRKPVARVMRNKGGSYYISNEGKMIPTSDKFTARVLIITGAGTDALSNLDTLVQPYGKALVETLNYIDKDPFWKAQITQIDIDEDMHLTLYPTVGEQVIEFGEPADVEKKFQRLALFYDKIVPAKGWTAYRKVKLGFNNQIVCE